jgi:YbgC/YbaW family acyl-CoA thioester hydrolase
MAFVTTHTVRFAEIDAAGIAFFSRMYEWSHFAYEQALASVGLPLMELLESSEVLMPLVHSEADYKAPCRLGDELTIEVVIESSTQRSATWKFTFTGQDDILRGVVRLVCVPVNREFKPVKGIPESWAELFKGAGLYEQ